MGLKIMKQKLLTAVTTLLLVLLPGGALTMTASAACASGNNAASQVLSGIDQTPNPDCTGSGVNNAVTAATNILSFIVGVAAIIMILVSAFRYITSGNDSNRVGAAKNTLIYAIIGLVIAGICQALVHFVLSTSAGAAPCPSNPAIATSDAKCK
jgi:ABC-type Fe3+ transport system permease subunit